MATIGPATSSEAGIRDLIAAGVDVCRLNFSHGTHEGHREVIERIRAAADQQGRSVAILQDLSGPKIRTGLLQDGPFQLHPGDKLQIAVGHFAGGPGRISTSYAELPGVCRVGGTLLLDDGHIELRVESIDGNEMRTVVVDGGSLGEHKGINVPGVELPADPLTPKDIEDLKFGVAAGVDFMALSFVRRGTDVRQARELLRAEGASDLPLIAKLERPEAVTRIGEILNVADAVMVARGDLGLELPLEQVPRVQKEVTRRARALGMPVIVATQVLESMRTEPRPTRAEVSDAANAVYDGVDAIMLAGETAAGKYPIRAVETLDAIIRDAETIPSTLAVTLEGSHVMGGHGRAICQAAITLAERGAATAIVAITRGGKTARLLSALRPRAPIYAATDQPVISRLLALAWGVVPVVTDLSGDVQTAAARIGRQLVDRGVVAPASVIVIVSISPDPAHPQSNFLKLMRV